MADGDPPDEGVSMGGLVRRGRGAIVRAVAPLANRVLPRLGRRSASTVLAGARRLGLERRATPALLREAQRRFRDGEPERARDILEAVGARDDGRRPRADAGSAHTHPDLLIAQIRALIATHDLEHARDLAEEGVRAHPRGIRLADLLIGLLDQLGEPERAFGLAVDNAGRRLRRLERKRVETPAARHLTRDTRIFISGYFYSGSGAVLDHLRDYPGAVKWTPTGELRLLKFPGGFGDLSKRLADNGSLGPQDLLDLYLHITGWKVTLSPEGVYDQWAIVNRYSRRMYRRPIAFGYLAALLRCFLELAERPEVAATTEDLEDHFRRHLERALDAAATDAEADLLLVDQAITAWKIDLARLVPPSTFISVHRDPRDQFAEVQEVLKQPGRRELTAEDFAKRNRRNRKKVERLAPDLERDHGHRVLRIGFEEFVMDHERWSHRLADVLDLDPAARVPDRFDPARSRANIGKHAALLDERDRATLEDAMAEFLSPHADVPVASLD
jgi:hypothetical protein